MMEMDEDLERRLEQSGRFPAEAEIDVSAIRVNDFGEGEYEARFAYPRDYDGTREEDFLLRLKRELEDELPGAWVTAFTVSSDRDRANDVIVIFDFLPEGSRIAS